MIGNLPLLFVIILLGEQSKCSGRYIHLLMISPVYQSDISEISLSGVTCEPEYADVLKYLVNTGYFGDTTVRGMYFDWRNKEDERCELLDSLFTSRWVLFLSDVLRPPIIAQIWQRVCNEFVEGCTLRLNVIDINPEWVKKWISVAGYQDIYLPVDSIRSTVYFTYSAIHTAKDSIPVGLKTTKGTIKEIEGTLLIVERDNEKISLPSKGDTVKIITKEGQVIGRSVGNITPSDKPVSTFPVKIIKEDAVLIKKGNKVTW